MTAKHRPVTLLSSMISAIWLSTPLFAAHEVGNGGFGIYCANEYPQLFGKRSLLVDFFLGFDRNGWRPNLGHGNSIEEKVGVVLDRLQEKDPERADRLAGWAATFFDEALIASPSNFPAVPRPAFVLPGADCQTQHVAFQNRSPGPGEMRYLIDADRWDALDDDSRAGLVLHELVYRSVGANDFRNAVYFTAFISGGGVGQMTQGEYDTFIDEHFGFTRVRRRFVHHGREFWSDTARYDADGNLSFALDVDDHAFEFYPSGQFKTIEIPDLGYFSRGMNVYLFPVETPDGRVYGPTLHGDDPPCTVSSVKHVALSEEGYIQSAEFLLDSPYVMLCHRETGQSIGGMVFQASAGFELFPTGGFRSLVAHEHYAEDQAISLFGIWLASKVGERIDFHDNGLPRLAWPTNHRIDLGGAGSLVFLTRNGTLQRVRYGQLVEFDREGYLIRW